MKNVVHRHPSPPARACWPLIASLATLAALVSLSCSKPATTVEVFCYAVDKRPMCNVTMEKKGPDMHVCWDVVMTCANKVEARQNKCSDVNYRKTTQVPLELSDFSDIDKCDVARMIQVANIVQRKQ